jgi:hypothetical protein
MASATIDLFENPVGSRTSLQKKRGFLNKIHVFYRFLSGSCSETEVTEQLYCTAPGTKMLRFSFTSPMDSFESSS